jgi:hypothetical protein
MNVNRYKMFQDALHVILTAVAAGVLFSMAVTGVVFLLSGPTPGRDAADAAWSQPASAYHATPAATPGERAAVQ